MSYDNTSFNGDTICDDYYDSQNNLMNPESPVGFLVYKLIGGGFDKSEEEIITLLNDISIVNCQPHLLNIYGRYYNIPRLTVGNRLMTDEEYRIYLYLTLCRLLTIEDIQINFNKVFQVEDYTVRISTVDLTDLVVSDHTEYVCASENIMSNIQKNSSDSGENIIVDHDNTSEVNTLKGRTGHVFQKNVLIEVPSQEWGSVFLSVLMKNIGIKNNIIIREYMI